MEEEDGVFTMTTAIIEAKLRRRQTMAKRAGGASAWCFETDPV